MTSGNWALILGRKVRVPRKNGSGHWWVEVVGPTLSDAFVMVQGGRMAGSRWPVHIDRCELRNGKSLRSLLQ